MAATPRTPLGHGEPARHRRLSLAAAATTPNAGTADNVTITAKDSYGNTATSYARLEQHDLRRRRRDRLLQPDGVELQAARPSTSEAPPRSASQTAWPRSPAPQRRDASVQGRETASITASEGGSYTSNALSVTVSPLGISTLSLAAATTTPTAGAADNLTITAKDSYGNTATSYIGFTQPDLRRRERDRLLQPDRLQLQRHSRQLRHRHRTQLHKRRGHGLWRLERRDAPVQGGGGTANITASEGR